MGMFFIQPAHAGSRFRDDYGATPASVAASLSHDAAWLACIMGGLKHVA
ncbi:hypothetical protein EIO60_00817|nr:hypothetical protein [Candidatus Pantoea persica]